MVLEEMRPERRVPVSAGELLEHVAAARAFLAAAGLRKGDRCALLAPNSIQWVALDLAAMADGIIVVPLYPRQTPAELAAMIRDAQPAIICCGDAALQRDLRTALPGSVPHLVLLEEIFAAPTAGKAAAIRTEPVPLADSDPVTIIYTSGTSGESKGVVLNVGNVTYMLSCTTARLELLMGKRAEPDRVFHYLPFCFAGSWILLLSCLLRLSELRLSTDLTRLADDLREAAPDYCLNVPQLLERMRSAVEMQLAKRGGFANKIFANAKAASLGNGNGARGGIALLLARKLIFPTIRKKLGPKNADLIQTFRGAGAAGVGNTTFLSNARNSSVAKLRAHRDDCDLHHGRSPTRRAGRGRTGDPWRRDEAGRPRRDSRPGAKHFFRLLEPAGGDSQGGLERLVPHGRSGRTDSRR